MNLRIPRAFEDLLKKRARYKIYTGGRGSAKSWSFASSLIVLSLTRKARFLCVRQIQRSIKESVYKLLVDRIVAIGAEKHFTFKIDSIVCNSTGSEFMFKGLFGNVSEIKSLEGIDYCWLEEGQSANMESLELLIPTIRKPGSEIWISMNRDTDDDAVYQKLMKDPQTLENLPDSMQDFFTASKYDEITIIRTANWTENPDFPAVLRLEMEHDKRTNYDRYLHVWEGYPRAHSDAQVFKGKFSCQEFETPDKVTFYHGADWGFSNDPTTLVRCFVQDNRLHIDQEVWGIGIEIDDIAKKFKAVESVFRGWDIYADSARPETISFVQRQGINIYACRKWKGSVEDGVEFLKTFDEIIIHPRCEKTLEEFKLYNYRIDKRTGKVLPEIADANNHCIDALRYAVQDLISVANDPVFTRGI